MICYMKTNRKVEEFLIIKKDEILKINMGTMKSQHKVLLKRKPVTGTANATARKSRFPIWETLKASQSI